MSELEENYIKRLEDDVATLRERVRQLEEMLLGNIVGLPVELALTTHEAALVAALLRAPEMSKDRLLTALYGHLPDAAPEVKIIDVFVCKARKKLKPFHIVIETIWGRGYRMTPPSKIILRQMMAAAAVAA